MLTTDPATTVGLVDREVRTGTRDGVATRLVVARRTYAADRDELWDAVTNPERLPRWFTPVSGDLVLGGHYQLEGNAGGVVQRCDPPRGFAVTWEFGEMTSWLAVALDTVDDGTTLELVHEAPVDPAMWGQFGPGAVGVGWDLALLGLGLHVEEGTDVDHEEAEAFGTSPEGVAFIDRAARAWADAAIADGDEAGAARAAAAATIAFYTTPPEAPTRGDEAGDEAGDEPGA